jgi:two-component system CheB/CheR fusion protein
MMDELLARRTRLAIVQAEDGIALRPNAIFLMPPRKEMIQSGRRLFLTDKDPSQGFALPIDRYLRSLAQDSGIRSVGVILSGTGSDGSRGIRDVHDVGGLVVAQNEESAKFDGMPRSARETGLVDLVLPPAEMADAILKLVRMRRLPDASGEGTVAVPEVGLQAIFRMLRTEYGIDFSQYKPSTVSRRVERRLLLNQSMDVGQYVGLLAESGAELNQLYKDLLIGVTQFFRDREAFHRLATNELPRLLSAITDEQELRVWVAGCATGEEAYSLAILVHEQLIATGRHPTVRIFATDVHRASLEFASAGVYTEEALTMVSHQRREQYFLRKGEAYQVTPQLRKMIVFAPHDLLKDAPFTRLDLVTCRNLLIYLQPAAQKKILSLFHFGLKTGGVLFLGPSESPGDLLDEFEPVDDHWKQYRKRRDVRLRTELRTLLPSAPMPIRWAGSRGGGGFASDRMQQALYDRLLEEHMPPSFLVNDRKELLHTFGSAGKLLRVRDGRSSNQILDLVDQELKLVLSGALARADKQFAPVVFTGLRLPTETHGETLSRLTVKPLQDRLSGLTSFLILVEDMNLPAPPRDEAAIDLGAATREQVQNLEQELRHTRENLQAMIEEQESSNEELQATNEELVASNEQLQSTNEELHSVNEELYTVNAEYQHKIDELTLVTADLENLLQATDVGIVFLDRNLCIRRFTPRIAKLFNLLPHDVGRPLGSFVSRLEMPLTDPLEQVLRTGRLVEREVRDIDGHSYFLRIMSYRINDVAGDGVVVSLIDISSLKRAESQLQHLSALVKSSADAIIGKDLEGRIVSWNRGAEELFGYAEQEALGRSAEFLYPADSTESFRDIVDAVRDGESISMERRRIRRDGTVIDILHTVSPIFDPHQRVIGLSTISRDISSRKRDEAAIQVAIRNRDHFLAMLSHELRNPLGAILNAMQVLDCVVQPDERFMQASRVVRRQAEQMAVLLDDLLDVARVTQNKIVLQREVLDLADVIEDAATIIRPLAVERRQSLQVLKADPGCLVEGDPARLQQVVVNLLKNAVKYSGDEAAIRVELRSTADEVFIIVSDNGLGIAAEMLPHIFELFVQSHASVDRSDGGLGVGLTLVRSIVELHGGRVEALSEGPHRGSEFTVRLPRLTAPLANIAAAPADSPAETLPFRPCRIALVEDNDDSRVTLKMLLDYEGHEVRSASDGREGLDLILAWRPEVAIIDIGLPLLDGFDVARRVREFQREHPDAAIHLIALTGYGLPTDREKILAAGFDRHFVKPLKLTDLSDAIRRLG